MPTTATTRARIPRVGGPRGRREAVDYRPIIGEHLLEEAWCEEQRSPIRRRIRELKEKVYMANGNTDQL